MRLFIAIVPPVAARRRIDRLARPLRKLDVPVRWVEPEAYHLTLKFLGEVERDRIGEVVEAMREAISGEASLGLAPGRLAAVPALERPRVLWIEIETDPALTRIQAKLEGALAARGFPQEERPFRPHLTLGRLRRSGPRGDLAALPEVASALDFSEVTFPVDSVVLMASEREPEGARYRVVSRLTLSPAGR